MNILFFCRLFYPHIGGVERHVLEVSKQLAKKGFSITVVTEQYSDNLPLRETFKGIKIYRIPLFGSERQKKYMIWNWIFQHRKLLDKAEIIHCHDVFFWYLPFRLLFPLKKVFTTFHGYEGNDLPSFRAVLMHKIAELLSSGNICIGEFLRKWYKTKPTYVSYGGVQQSKAIAQPSKRVKEIVFLGRLEEETGIIPCLEALLYLKGRGVYAHMSVLGDGELSGVAKSYVRKHRLNVTFHGFVQNVDDFLDRCDVVFTSRYLGILEAFIHKKFTLATYNNEIKKDYLTMTPFRKWISITKDGKQLSEQIGEYIENPSIFSLSLEKAYVWATSQTWRELALLYARLWNTG